MNRRINNFDDEKSARNIVLHEPGVRTPIPAQSYGETDEPVPALRFTA